VLARGGDSGRSGDGGQRGGGGSARRPARGLSAGRARSSARDGGGGGATAAASATVPLNHQPAVAAPPPPPSFEGVTLGSFVHELLVRRLRKALKLQKRALRQARRLAHELIDLMRRQPHPGR
jgi:hypothetical protein